MHICKYCGKEFETGQKLGGHSIRCELNPNKDKNEQANKSANRNIKNSLKFIKYNDNTNVCNCQYCQKECKGLNSLKQHEIRCKENPNKINSYIPGFNNIGHVSWNKGLSKDTDIRLNIWSKNMHKKYKSGEILIWNKGLTKDTDKRIAKIVQSQKSNINCGGYRENSGIGKHGKYKNIRCDSTWELAYILYCNDHNITIKRCNKRFDYYDNEGNKHRYYPDFIINDNEIIEIKGHTDKKWELKQSIVEKENITVLYKNDMKDILKYCYEKYGDDLTYLYDK